MPVVLRHQIPGPENLTGLAVPRPILTFVPEPLPTEESKAT